MSFLSKTKTLIVGALALGTAALAAAAPAQATYFDDFDYPRVRTVVVKKRIIHPHHDFHGYDYPRVRTVFVKKRFVHPRHHFYGHRRVGFGVGFHGHRGYYGGF